MDLNTGNVLAKIGVVLREYLDFCLWPMVLALAWFYYPYCQTGPTLCLWRAILHEQCLGCGLTRGLCFLVHGRVAEATRFNPLSAVAFALMAVSFFKSSRELFRAVTSSLASAPRLSPKPR